MQDLKDEKKRTRNDDTDNNRRTAVRLLAVKFRSLYLAKLDHVLDLSLNKNAAKGCDQH